MNINYLVHIIAKYNFETIIQLQLQCTTTPVYLQGPVGLQGDLYVFLDLVRFKSTMNAVFYRVMI